MVGKITINYADAVNNIEKVSKSAKDTAETLEDVDKKADGAGDSVEDAGQAAKNADSGFTTWKATLANLASTAITKVISGCTQLAEKMADVTKSAVGHYAEYEQLVGGVETLFKDSSGKLIDYAEKAYKTAGMNHPDESYTMHQANLDLYEKNAILDLLKSKIFIDEETKERIDQVTTERDAADKVGKEAIKNAVNSIRTSRTFTRIQ